MMFMYARIRNTKSYKLVRALFHTLSLSFLPSFSIYDVHLMCNKIENPGDTNYERILCTRWRAIQFYVNCTQKNIRKFMKWNSILKLNI